MEGARSPYDFTAEKEEEFIDGFEKNLEMSLRRYDECYSDDIVNLDRNVRRLEEKAKTNINMEPQNIELPAAFAMSSEEMNNMIDLTLDTISANEPDGEQKEAQISFLKGKSMQEAEDKINALLNSSQKSLARLKMNESMAESAAIAAALSNDNEVPQGEEKFENLKFNITETDLDITFMPSDDPHVYKPLEIITYLAMTKCE